MPKKLQIASYHIYILSEVHAHVAQLPDVRLS